MTVDQNSLNAAGALYALADTAREERALHTDGEQRAELQHITDTLTEAARQALHRTEVYGWAWVKAGASFIHEYRVRRLYGEVQVISWLCRHRTIDREHAACIHCDCGCHRGG